MERTKCPILETVAKGDSNPGSLDCESGVLPLSYRAPHMLVLRRLRKPSTAHCNNSLVVIFFLEKCSYNNMSTPFLYSKQDGFLGLPCHWWSPGKYQLSCALCMINSAKYLKELTSSSFSTFIWLLTFKSSHSLTFCVIFSVIISI